MFPNSSMKLCCSCYCFRTRAKKMNFFTIKEKQNVVAAANLHKDIEENKDA